MDWSLDNPEQKKLHDDLLNTDRDIHQAIIGLAKLSFDESASTPQRFAARERLQEYLAEQIKMAKRYRGAAVEIILGREEASKKHTSPPGEEKPRRREHP